MICGGAVSEYQPYGRRLLPFHPKDTGFTGSNHHSSWLCPETETSRDLFRAFKAVTIAEESPKERWLLRGCEEGEEELYFSDNTVIWSKSDGRGCSRLVKSFSVENKVIDAVWCTFIDDLDLLHPNLSCLVVNDSVLLEIFSKDGDFYPIGLPFQISRLIPTEHGLLLERVPVSSEGASSSTPLPLIFSLVHPLKDIAPVILKSCSAKSHGQSFFTGESKLQLVGICKEWSLCVFFSKTDGVQSVWSLRNATDDEVRIATAVGTGTASSSKTPSMSESPFVPSSRQTSQSLSPFSSINTTKQTSQTLSSPSINQSKSQSHSLSHSSSSSLLSPLRSSRLAATQGSPLIRGFGSPSGQFTPPFQPSPSDARTCRTQYINSPTGRFSVTPQGTEYDFSDDINEPIYPELCLEYIWSEPIQTANSKASKVFVTTDLMGQTYLAMLSKQQEQLKLVRFEYSNDGHKLIFGTLSVITAKDAEPIAARNMMLTLDSSNTLALYSGIYKVSIVYLPSCTPPTYGLGSPSSSSKSFVFQSPISHRASLIASSRPTSAIGLNPHFSLEGQFLSPVIKDLDLNRVSFEPTNLIYQPMNNIVSVQDAVEERVSIECSQSTFYRFSLPSLASSTIVNMCLDALKAVLPRDISMQLMVKWYSTRNAPGPNEFTDEKELNLFKYCLLSLVGYDIDDLPFDLSLSMLVLSERSPEMVKKQKLEVDEAGNDDDWNWMQTMASVRKESSLNSSISPTPSAILFPYLRFLLYSLHLTYEEIKLHTLLWEFVPHLLDMLYIFATDLKLMAYTDHYWRDFPVICSKLSSASRLNETDAKGVLHPSFFTESPPAVYTFLQSLLKSDNYTKVSPFPYLPVPCQRTKICILLNACIQNESVSEREFLLPIHIHQKAAKLDEFEVKGIKCREERLVLAMDSLGLDQSFLQSLPVGLAMYLWESIFYCRRDPPADWSYSCYSLIGRPDLLALNDPKSISCRSLSKQVDADAEEDGLIGMNKEALRLLFPEDQRVYEAYNMLQSSKPAKILINQRPGVSDHDFIEEQERHLYTICIRTMALPLGRGMLTLKTYKPVVAETFPIPKLSLSGRVPPRNTAVELAHIDVPANMNTWPLFHNGVAAGLRASPSASDIIDSSWIVYNKPKSNASGANDAQNEHAGFLLALGLNGHLSRLSMMNIHDYLCRGNELTRVAVLLGLAAAKRGSMDMSAVKVLSIHVEALLPPTSTELDVPPVVQVAAVLGVGLLYEGSGQHHIAEVLLGEIGRPPGPEMEHYIDRESYALAAGLAFGLVTLGKGKEMVSLVSSAESVSMADQLCNYMIGGHKKPLTTVQREKYRTPSYQIREGDYVNADVTSPGATLALGLMFFDTNNEAVAKWVTAPDTQHLLETVRPDFILLRTLSKGLIMWSNIRPTKEWVDSHIPPVVSENAFQRQEDYNSRIDYETMSQAFCNIIAGACMSLGLKFAGSASREAFKVVMGYTKMFLSLPSKPQLADQAGRSTIESCLNVLIISLAMIMAGTGNVEVMKICRYLRSRISQVNVVLYGSHLATHMALGLLFLGGCRYTLSTSPQAIAALICAFFPKFPIHSNDNRYHLQAFRHLYVLAVEPRLVIPRDIDTGKFVYVHIKVTLQRSEGNDEKKKVQLLRAPCLIPELDLLEEVIVDDPRYWKVSFQRHKNWEALQSFLSMSGVMNVKQKVGCLPYSEDPKGYKSIHSQYLMKDLVRGWTFGPNVVAAFSNDPVVVNFSSYLMTPKANFESECEIQQNLCSALVGCASSETIECLPSLIELQKYVGPNACPDTLSLWQIKMTISVSRYCQSLRDDFVEGLKSFVDKRIENADFSDIVKYLKGETPLTEVTAKTCEALVLYDMPPYASLSPLQGGITFPDLVLNLRHFSMPMSTLITLAQNFK